MGHNISAVLLQGAFDKKIARVFGLQPVQLPQGITLFPLEAKTCDHWAEALGIAGFVSDRPLLNSRVIHHMIRKLAPKPLFAVIETSYFGGSGDQTAAVYHGDVEVMAPASAAFGPINEALRRLGAQASAGMDEFDTVGLRWFRGYGDFFDTARE